MNAAGWSHNFYMAFRAMRSFAADKALLHGVSVKLPVVRDVADGDALGSAPIRLRDVVFQIACTDAPHAPAADLNSTQFPGLQQCPDLIRAYVQLFGRLLGAQEAVPFRFLGHQFILCAGCIAGV